jgi:hypothetical protein
MNEIEMRELNLWIAINVFAWKAQHHYDKCDGTKIIKCGACGELGHANCYGPGRGGAIQLTCAERPCCEWAQPKAYTNDSAASMELQKKCYEKLGLLQHAASTAYRQSQWCVCEHPPLGPCTRHAMADSLELAWVLFAKQLFS